MKNKEQVQIPHRNIVLENWAKSLMFSFLVYVLVYIYFTLLPDHATGTRLISQTTADAGMLLICISFMFSGISYFWDFGDKFLVLRKYIGLIGFYLICIHFYYTFRFALTNPQRALGDTSRVISAFLGFFSLIIFLQMAIISPVKVTQIMGAKPVRILLRVGYLAVLLGFIHYAMKEYDAWLEWIKTFDPALPPFSLILSLIVLYTFWLRFRLYLKVKG